MSELQGAEQPMNLLLCALKCQSWLFLLPPPPFFADIFDDNGQCLDSAELLAS